MIAAVGGAGEASRAKVRSGWAKFKELAPILTSRGGSLRVEFAGPVCRECLCTVEKPGQ